MRAGALGFAPDVEHHTTSSPWSFRILKLHQWHVRQRSPGQRPRVQGGVSRASRPNERWAIDTTHFFCGRDGWCHLTAIIDCYDRTIGGW